MYLLDSNILLEGLLEQEKSKETYSFIKSIKASDIYLSDFSVYSIGISLLRLKKFVLFKEFINDIYENGSNIVSLSKIDLEQVADISQKFNLDFDDSYQYVVVKKLNIKLVSFDKDFDKTDLKRIEP